MKNQSVMHFDEGNSIQIKVDNLFVYAFGKINQNNGGGDGLIYLIFIIQTKFVFLLFFGNNNV